MPTKYYERQNKLQQFDFAWKKKIFSHLSIDIFIIIITF